VALLSLMQLARCCRNLFTNRLSGTLPPEWGAMTALTTLYARLFFPHLGKELGYL
jgi:hypothetical protein